MTEMKHKRMTRFQRSKARATLKAREYRWARNKAKREKAQKAKRARRVRQGEES
jgi:hypothetical protein